MLTALCSYRSIYIFIQLLFRPTDPLAPEHSHSAPSSPLEAPVPPAASAAAAGPDPPSLSCDGVRSVRHSHRLSDALSGTGTHIGYASTLCGAQN
eukprot:879211-Rhodomonas_salina.2